MDMAESPIAASDGSGMPSAVSAPFVRVFALSTGDDLADECRALAVSEAAATAHRVLQVGIKLRIPSAWRAAIDSFVTSCSGLTVYAQSHGMHEDVLLLIGRRREIEAWASALSSSGQPTAALAQEILAQLGHIYPRTYRTLQCGAWSVDFSASTGIMGILNVTPDSFYDGGRYLDLRAAVDRAYQMVAEGAHIIDIGGQSSRPGSEPASEAEEAHRVLPVIAAVAKSVPAMISVDTYRAGIARAALDAGAHLINDISALRFDPALLHVVAARRVPLILMHMQGMPRNMQLNPTYEALLDEVFAFLRQRIALAQAGGIPAERLLIDPGIGFGKGARHNLELLRKLHHFQVLGRPIVIGTSRKSFIGRILGTEVHERLEGTAATVAAAIMQGADIVRVHDVQAMVRVARMIDAMVRPNFDAHARGQTSTAPGHAGGEHHTGA